MLHIRCRKERKTQGGADQKAENRKSHHPAQEAHDINPQTSTLRKEVTTPRWAITIILLGTVKEGSGEIKGPKATKKNRRRKCVSATKGEEGESYS